MSLKQRGQLEDRLAHYSIGLKQEAIVTLTLVTSKQLLHSKVTIIHGHVVRTTMQHTKKVANLLSMNSSSRQSLPESSMQGHSLFTQFNSTSYYKPVSKKSAQYTENSDRVQQYWKSSKSENSIPMHEERRIKSLHRKPLLCPSDGPNFDQINEQKKSFLFYDKVSWNLEVDNLQYRNFVRRKTVNVHCCNVMYHGDVGKLQLRSKSKQGGATTRLPWSCVKSCLYAALQEQADHLACCSTNRN